MTAPKKASLVKAVIGVIVAAATGGAADAAGYTPDLAELERLGILGSVLLILYIEYRAMPILRRIAKMDPAKAPAEEGVEVDVFVEEPRRITSPHLVAVPPAKDPR